jgi:hypothetical protein
MPTGNFQPNESAPALRRVEQAASYIFSAQSGLTIARIALRTGETNVVMAGYTSDQSGDAAFVVGLARHADGQVVYEHHVERWRDTDSLTTVRYLGEDLPSPPRRHEQTCALNIGSNGCIRLEASPQEDYARVPRYNWGSNEPESYRTLPESGAAGVASMIERFATSEYGDISTGANVQEALIVIGGASAVFRDPAMQEFANAIAS